jgi:SnoaL-like domain
MALDEAAVQVLLDKQAIYDLMCRYCRAVDRLDKELLLSCFWPGAIDVHLGKGGQLYTGTVEEYFDAEWDGFKDYTVEQHYLCNMLIEVDGYYAVAETYQFSLHVQAPGDDPEKNRVHSNRYHDVFERRNNEWRILRRDFQRNFAFPIHAIGFATAENGWPAPLRNRDDLAYRTVADFTRSLETS